MLSKYLPQLKAVIKDFDFLPDITMPELTIDTKIAELAPDWDSLDSVELIMAIEDYYSIEIRDGEAEAVVTIGDLLVLIEAKRSRLDSSLVQGPSLLELSRAFTGYDGPEVSGKVIAKKPPQIRVSATLTKEQQQAWQQLGGANWLRKQLAQQARSSS